MNIDTAKSYKTRKRLETELEKCGLMGCKPLIVRNSEGRWTAVFGYAISNHSNPASIARCGFHVIN